MDQAPTIFEWVILSAAVITALYVIWNKAIKPIARALILIEEFGPVLIGIAEQFRPNHGSSLFDRIKRMDEVIEGMHGDIKTLAKYHLSDELNAKQAEDEVRRISEG